jgi:uncharacterized 2Fe-2S/4Fe-4S cluster protein (DUF4445 family)
MSLKKGLQVDSPDGSHSILPGEAERRHPISDLLRHVDLHLNTRCGQRGLCDGCIVELVNGQLVHCSTGQTVSANGQPHIVRGCEHHLAPGQSARIRIPARSILRYEPQVVTDYRINIACSHDPLCQQLQIELDDSGRPIDEQVRDRVREFHPGVVELNDDALNDCRALVGRRDAWAITEARPQHRLVTALAPQPADRMFGAAIDIGTTTVGVLLIDLLSGQVVSRSAAFNEQMRMGDDVLTRINLCATDPANLHRLRQAVVQQTIQPMLQGCLSEADADWERLRCLCFAANTTMLHLLAGIDPTPMGTAPFSPVFLAHRVLPAHDVFGSDAKHAPPPNAACHLLPGAASYVGADLTAGILASGLAYDPGPSMLVDVGTNGEIILKHGDQLLGCATAAGPAFEGARLSCGMRAGRGAVSHVRIEPATYAVEAEIIGPPRQRAVGVCGSAYVDLLAAGRRSGLLTETGRFDPQTPEGLQRRIVPSMAGEPLFRVCNGPGKAPIGITEKDIARLLQAKAAIAAGILTLLERVRLQPRDIKTLYLAGGFGTHLNRENAVACGLLPGFDPAQIQPVGNTSLAGAYLAMIDSGIATEMARIADHVQVIELNLEPGFEMSYIDQLALP